MTTTDQRPDPKWNKGDKFMIVSSAPGWQTWTIVDEPFWELSAKGEQWWYPMRQSVSLNFPESDLTEEERL